MKALDILPLFAVLLISTNAQRYAPGVPPPQQQQQQQYQQPPQQQQQQYQPPPQQQQQQQQYQPPPQQQQQQQQQQYQQQPPQPPQQQQQQNQPPQQQQQQNQPPPQQQQQQQAAQMNQQQQQHHQQPAGGHGHGHDSNLRFSSDVHNAAHVMDHLENVIETKTKDQMSEEELEFHYFKMHDYDNNNKLDGVEIGKALTHYHDAEPSNSTDSKDSSNPPPEQKIYVDEMISNIVDSVLKENDLNGDGYIEYVEFKSAQEVEKQKRPPPAPTQDNN